MGGIAAYGAGETPDAGDIVIESSAKLRPCRDEHGSNSRDTAVEIDGLGKFTVSSLRALLGPRIVPPEGDPFAAWEDDEEGLIHVGLRRATLTHMALRDQPILDQYPDEIFRLPVGTRCFLSGPPGTGKTTR